jgi:hypothetical protein
MDNKPELEIVYKIYPASNSDIFHYELMPDADGLGLVELRYVEVGRKEPDRITMRKEEAMLLYEALGKMLGLGQDEC